jgi:hypothetical protein
VRRVLPASLIAAAIVFAASPPLAAGHRSHKRSGIAGTVLNTSCPGPCVQPSSAPPYTGSDLTVTVRRVRDGALIASVMPTTGHFRIRVKRGHYDVSATVPAPPPCGGPVPVSAKITCPPCGPVPVGAKIACPVAGSSIYACPTTGDTVRVAVRRHRFTHVELHVQNACIVTAR